MTFQNSHISESDYNKTDHYFYYQTIFASFIHRATITTSIQTILRVITGILAVLAARVLISRSVAQRLRWICRPVVGQV